MGVRVLAAAVVGWLGLAAGAWAQVPALFGDRQLVVPFEDASATARLSWLSEASAVLLTDDLVKLGAATFSREERVLAFDRLHVPPATVLTHATVIRIGQLVGASQVIVGSYVLTGETLTVRARALRLDTGRLLPEISESAPLSDVFEIYGRIARRLAPASPATDEQLAEGRPSLPAFEQFIKGLLAQAPAAQLAFFEQALRLEPGFQRARLGLWEVHTARGEHQRALDIVRQVPPGHRFARRARFLASLSLLELGQFGAAADTLADLQRQQQDASLANNLGVVQIRRPPGASLVKASSFFLEATRADPTDADLYFNLGYAYWLEKNLPAAIEALREVVRRDPADGDAHFVLAAALQLSGSGVEAARERALARQLSSTYAEWEARPSGTTAVPRALERVKTDLDVPATMRINDLIGAVGQREQQDQAVFHLDAGKRLFAEGRDVEAIAELRRAVYLAPYQSEAHLMLGRAYLRLGRTDDAVSALKISIWSADTPAARLTLAEAYMQLKDVDAARGEAQTVLRRDPSNVDARGLLERLPAN